MSAHVETGLVAITFMISWYAAWSAGRSWRGAERLRGLPWYRVWCVAVVSAAGFTWVYLVLAATALRLAGLLGPGIAAGLLQAGVAVATASMLGAATAAVPERWIGRVTARAEPRVARRGNASRVSMAVSLLLLPVSYLLKGLHWLGETLDWSSKHVLQVGRWLAGKGSGDRRPKLLVMVVLLSLAVTGGALTTFLVAQAAAQRRRVAELFAACPPELRARLPQRPAPPPAYPELWQRIALASVSCFCLAVAALLVLGLWRPDPQLLRWERWLPGSLGLGGLLGFASLRLTTRMPGPALVLSWCSTVILLCGIAAFNQWSGVSWLVIGPALVLTVMHLDDEDRQRAVVAYEVAEAAWHEALRGMEMGGRDAVAIHRHVDRAAGRSRGTGTPTRRTSH